MKSILIYTFSAFTIFLLLFSKPKNGEDVIQAMHKKYEKSWYNTLTFKQATFFYNAKEELTKEQTWFEAMLLPSSLTVKYDKKTSGDGIVFRNDSVFTFKQGKIELARRYPHVLLILGFSVYTQNPEKTIKDLKSLHIDFSKLTTKKWQGKVNYVIGDENATHFYIEKERLLFTRLIQKYPNNITRETQFNKYQPLQKGWVSPEVLFFTNGKMTLKEVYSEIKTPVLNEEIFNIKKFKEIKW